MKKQENSILSPSQNPINLDKLLNGFLKGQSFLEWANVVTEKLVKESGQNDYIFHLKHLLPLLKIRNVNFIQSEIRGALKPLPDGFELLLSKKINGKQTLKFIVAHELSHLFFYDLHSKPPKHLVYLSQGSAELEYACNVLARCLLLPKNLTINFIKDFFRQRDVYGYEYNLFYLILNLSQRFEVNYYNVITRIFDDLDVVEDCVMIEFTREGVNKDNDSNSKQKFRAKSIKISKNLTKQGLYIPYPQKERKSISAKAELEKLLDEIYSDFELVEPIGYRILKVNNKGFFKLGNLDDFVIKHFNEKNFSLPIYYMLMKNSIYVLFSLNDIKLGEPELVDL